MLVYKWNEDGTITYFDARNIKVSKEAVDQIEKSYTSKLVKEVKAEEPIMVAPIVEPTLEVKVEEPTMVAPIVEPIVEASAIETPIVQPLVEVKEEETNILYSGAKLSLMSSSTLEKLRAINPQSATDLFEYVQKIKKEEAEAREIELAEDRNALKELMQFEKEEIKEAEEADITPVALEEEPVKVEATIEEKPKKHNKKKETKTKNNELEIMSNMVDLVKEMQQEFQKQTIMLERILSHLEPENHYTEDEPQLKH